MVTDNSSAWYGLGVSQVNMTMTIDYTYDPLYRLTSADYSTGSGQRYYHYTYDAVGNRLTQDSMVNGLSSMVAYTYDEANRLASVDGVTYTWDNNGNLLSDGGNTYTYDSANRLIAVSGEQEVASSYAYNGLGGLKAADENHIPLPRSQ